MKIEEVRTSFTVYLIASDLKRLDGVAESLGLAGYMAATFGELTSAFSEFPSNPPHFLLFDATESRFDLKKAIQQVTAQLPESHIFLLVPFERRAEYVSWLEKGIYDFIYTPLSSPLELLRALDRAAERDYFMYMNEHLSEAQSSAPAASDRDEEALASSELTPVTNVPSVKEDLADTSFSFQLFTASDSDEAIRIFLRSLSVELGQCGAVYFKYVANRRVLMAQEAVAIKDFNPAGLGLNFNDDNSSFRSAHLRDPMGIPEFTSMVREVFATDAFCAFPVQILGEVQGLVLFLAHEPTGERRLLIDNGLLLLGKSLSLAESERRLHVSAVKDPITELLNRPNFLNRIQNEISRARRTSNPVSLLLLAVDQHADITAKFGPEEANTIMRLVARIMEKHSRVNDVLGRTANDEFGIVLPHTGRKGAMIKAERMRRLLQSADFGKVLHRFPHITVSIGIAEYPSHVRDAEELVQLADETLYSVRRSGNKTAVAQAADGFIPDFTLSDKEQA